MRVRAYEGIVEIVEAEHQAALMVERVAFEGKAAILRGAGDLDLRPSPLLLRVVL